jgi:outer membrane cobalamin receptor
VLLDGVPLNDPGGELNFAHVTTSELARIEVVRTPESALFGSEASTAVIQLFTRRGDPERRVPRGSLIYERGNFSTDRWLARAGGGAGSRLDYGLTAEQFRTSGEFENDTYRATTGAANAGIRLSPSTALRGVLRGQDTWLGVPGQVTYGFIDRDAHQTTRDWTGSLRLEDVRGARFVQRAMLGIHRLRDIYTDLGFDGPYTVAMLVRDIPGPVRRVQRVALLDPALAPLIIPSPGTRLVTRTSTLFPGDEPFLHRISRTNFDYQGTFSQDAATTTLGYEYDRQGGTISASEAVRNHHGVFAHHHHTLGRLSLSAGLRAEHSSEFGGKLAPRASASVRVMGERGSHSSTIFRISAARGITEPSLLQNFAREAFFQGNPDLRPEKTTSYDAGLVQEWFGRRVRSEISVFHSSFKDLIAFVSLPPPVWGSWENIEASKARGLEFSGLARVFGPVQVRGAYTRLYTRIVSSGNPASLVNGIGQELTRRPRNSGSVSLLIAPGRWWLQAGAQFVGERQDSDFIASNRNPGYQNVWAGASLDANQHISPFLRLDNALNSRFEEALGYSNLSRSIRGGLRLSW